MINGPKQEEEEENEEEAHTQPPIVFIYLICTSRNKNCLPT